MALGKLDEIKQAVSSLSKEEQQELAQYLASQTGQTEYPERFVDLTPFYGTVHFPEDAMVMQKRWRAEWD